VKPAPGLHAAVIACGLKVFAAGFDLLHAQGGLGIASGVVGKAITAGVFVDLLKILYIS
jgi:hypothetical protein